MPPSGAATATCEEDEATKGSMSQMQGVNA